MLYHPIWLKTKTKVIYKQYGDLNNTVLKFLCSAINQTSFDINSAYISIVSKY